MIDCNQYQKIKKDRTIKSKFVCKFILGLKTWIKQALSNRSKQERQRVYEAADAHDPSAMLAAIAEAEKAETHEEKQAEISGLRIS